MIEVLKAKREQISDICARHGVARLHVFGSALHEEVRHDDSDVDLLLELAPMDPYARVDAYFGLLEELGALLSVRIDLVMVGAVKNPYIARNIERTKQLLYAA